MTERAHNKPKYHKLYKTARWQRLREQHLSKYPYCQCPYHIGQRVLGKVVDHIQAHRGDTQLFFDPNNLQTLMAQCVGFNYGCDVSGQPLDLFHPWNIGTTMH